MSRQPNKRNNEQLQRGIHWPTVVGAVVAGVATLVSGYLIGRETEAQLREHHQGQRVNASPSSSSSTTVGVTHSVKETETPDEPAANEEDACVVCCDNKINAVNLPCRHSATCMSCARQMRRCCICNAPLQTVIKIFRA